MSNNPAWLSCENCLWWRSSLDVGNGWGCCYDLPSEPAGNFDRCHRWTCKRCLESWFYGFAEDPVNHLHCPIRGRGKPKSDMFKDFKTYFRCMCGQIIAGTRVGSQFHCLTCGRAWHLRQYGSEWWWPRGKAV